MDFGVIQIFALQYEISPEISVETYVKFVSIYSNFVASLKVSCLPGLFLFSVTYIWVVYTVIAVYVREYFSSSRWLRMLSVV